jgi:hypothetical protein
MRGYETKLMRNAAQDTSEDLTCGGNAIVFVEAHVIVEVRQHFLACLEHWYQKYPSTLAGTAVLDKGW